MNLKEGLRTASDAAQKAEKTAETMVKKAWSMMDVATEKTRPSQAISQDAIRKIQGVGQS